MIEIIAHRASYKEHENSIEGVKHYKKLGIGIEVDLRYGEHGIYMSHDPQKNGELFETMCKICVDSKMKIALHIKEISVVKETIELLKKYSLHNCFLFNTEKNDISKISDEFEIAEYVNQRPNNSKQKILWCDETKNKWYDKDFISNIHKKNKVVYAMSYEVVNPHFTENKIIAEWKRLIQLGIDGICTKYPERLIKFAKQGDLN